MTERVDAALEAAVAELAPQVSVAVAFSGGRDSTVLLHAAAGPFRGRIVAWHVNHHLVAECDAWERHCRAVSNTLGVPLEVDHVAVSAHRRVEENARAARYTAWRRRLRAGQVLLLAHHLDDQAETVLWRLLRGSGAELLRGMPRRRPLGAGELLRPLLALPRDEVAAYAARHALVWVEDPTNQQTRYDRSFLRNEIVPRLVTRFPDALAAIGRSAAALGRDAALVGTWLDARLVALGANADSLPIVALDEPDAPALLRQWLLHAGLYGVPTSKLTTTIAQRRSAPERTPMTVLDAGRSLRRYRDRLHLVGHPLELTPRQWRLGAPLELPHGTLDATLAEDGDLTRELETVEVRAPLPGERVVLAGRIGTHRLNSLFQHAGVPPWERARYPLLVREGALVMVPGIGVAASHAASGPGWHIRWTVRRG